MLLKTARSAFNRKEKGGKRKKRGQMQGLMLIGIFLFVMGVTILIAFRLITDFSDSFEDNPVIPDQGKSAVTDFKDDFATIFDAIFIFTLVLSSLLLVVSVIYIDTHPAFFAILFPAFIAVLVVNAVLINAFDDFGTSSGITDLYSDMPMTRFAAQNWIAIMSVVGFLTLGTFLAGKGVGQGA